MPENAGEKAQPYSDELRQSETGRPEGRLAALEARLDQLERRHAALANFVVPALWNALDRLYEKTERPDDILQCLACDGAARRQDYKLRHDECIFGGGRLERFECSSCGCVFGPEKYLQTPQKLVGLDMAHLYSVYEEGDSTEAEVRAFRMLEPKPGGVYLNWGSGAWSRSVEVLRAEGFDVWGFEPHVQNASHFVVRRREEIGAKFDGIFSNNVLEHLQDPAAQFRDFHAILKPDGRMVHATPCYDWLFAYSRFHVFFPLGDSVERLAQRTGFSVTGKARDGDFIARLFEARPAGPGRGQEIEQEK